MLRPESGQLLIHVPGAEDDQPSDMADMGRLITALAIIIDHDLRADGSDLRPVIRRADTGSLELIIGLATLAGHVAQGAIDMNAALGAWNNVLGITFSGSGLLAMILGRKPTRPPDTGAAELALEVREALGAVADVLQRNNSMAPLRIETTDQSVFIHEADVDRVIREISPPGMLVEEDVAVEIVDVLDDGRLVLATRAGGRIEASVRNANLRARIDQDGRGLVGYHLVCTLRRPIQYVPRSVVWGEIERVDSLVGWNAPGEESPGAVVATQDG